MLLALVLSACGPTQEAAQPTAAPAPQPTAAGEALEPLEETAVPEGPVLGEQPTAAPGAAAGNVTVADIIGNPSMYVGKTVTVNGNVDEQFSPNAFRLDEEAALAGGIDNDLLVIGSQQNFGGIDDQIFNDRVAVTGTVQNFVLQDIETEVGYDLQDDLYTDWANKPVLIASEVRKTAEREAGGGATGGNVTVADIVGNPNTYVGRTVTVNGDVQEMIGANAFTLDEEAALAGGIDNDLLVIGARQNLAGIDDQILNDRVRVTGVVRMLNIADVENEIGYDLDDNLFTNWNGKPVLIASAVTMAGAQAGATGGQGAAAGALSVADIMANPSAYISKTVTLRGEVQEVYGTSGFRLDEEALLAGGIDNDLLVIGSQANLEGIDDQILNDWVEVQGTVRPFVRVEFERDYDFFDPTPEVEARFEGQPVLIADSVTNLAPEGNRAPAPDNNVTVADIMDNTATYLGRTVTVNGDVEEMIGANAFKLDEEAFFAGGIDNDLLVIGAQQNLEGLDDQILNDRVRVSGTVRNFVIADIENALGYDLDDNLFTEWNNKPVLLAQSVQMVRPAPAAGVTLPEGALTVADVVSNPAALDGKQVTLRGEVQEVFGTNAFRMDEEALFAGGIDNDLLVIGAQQNLTGIDDQLLDDWVEVQGTVRSTFRLADVENEIGYDLDDTLFTEWEGRPVLVATAIKQLP
jgi:hypothetical protein